MANPIQTIAFLYPGAMGASLARTLHERQPHLTLLTDVSSRSESTISRSEAAGLIDTPLEEIVQRADLIISILPPSQALELAREVVALLQATPRASNTSSGEQHGTVRPPLIYLDANAISPGSTTELSKILEPLDIPFIDGCVIGLPATPEGHDPKIYLSSDPKWATQLDQVAEALSGRKFTGAGAADGADADGQGLKVRVMRDAGEGAASALKMCYGGINKGATGLTSLVVLGEWALRWYQDLFLSGILCLVTPLGPIIRSCVCCCTHTRR
jgi:3-hydroxyisobutyrate dehydrogenase-like beta-hydroxyacid dehydrogenase